MPTTVTTMKLMLAAALLAALAPGAQAQDRVSPQEAAAMQAQVQQALNEGAIAGDRAAAVKAILNAWQGSLENRAATEHLRATLNAASNRQLARIMSATSFQQVRAILLGDKLAAPGGGGVVIESLGDLNNDLVFTPNNPPCRIFDTRNIGGGVAPATGSTSNYQVYGDKAVIGAQGGNIAGCPAAKGEPVAISANFTAVPVGFQGHIRVFPYGGTLPTVSFVNFNGVVGNNIANSGIVSTCYLCAFDLSVYNGSQTHHIGDVMGYFYPVAAGDPALNQIVDSATATGYAVASPLPCCLFGGQGWVGPRTTHVITPTNRVYMVASHFLGSTTGAAGLNIFPCARKAGDIFMSGVGGGKFGATAAAGQRHDWSISWIFSGLAAGTYEFGMCYDTANTNWNNNEYGYVSTMVFNTP